MGADFIPRAGIQKTQLISFNKNLKKIRPGLQEERKIKIPERK